MGNMKLNEMEMVNGGEDQGPQYTDGGLHDDQKEMLKKVREKFEDQKAYFPKNYNGLYDNGEGWSFDRALCNDKKGPKIG